MKKLVSLLIVLLLAIPTLAPAEEEKVLNILTWAEYISYDDIIAPFEAETGIRVDYSFFDSNEEMLLKLEAVDAGTYDIVLASDYIIDIARGRDMLHALDKEKLLNYANINPAFLSQFYDPDNAFTVPYVAGIPMLLYDPELVDIEVTGYNSLWDESLRDSVVIMDDARNVVGITLKSMGESLNVTDPEILAKAEEKLMQLKPNIRLLDYNSTHLAMISGEASIGYMFTPAVAWARMEKPELEFIYPEEGIGFGIDSLFVPKNAPHPDNAHAFLDFLLRPEIGVTIAQNQAYLNVNQAAEPLLSEEYLANPVFKIPEDLMADKEFIQDVGEAQTIYTDIWTRFKQY